VIEGLDLLHSNCARYVLKRHKKEGTFSIITMKLLPELPQEIMQDILARSIHDAGTVQHCVQLLMVSKRIRKLAKSSGLLRVNGVNAGIDYRKLICFLRAWLRPVSSMVTAVDLSNNDLRPQSAPALARMMKKLKLTGLLSLDLSRNPFSDKGIRALATELGRFKNLQSLNLADNSCNEAGGAALIPELSKLMTLTSLNLGKNDGMMMGDNVGPFANALENLTGLTFLDLHSMTIWGDHLAMATALGTLTNLTALNLRKTLVDTTILAHLGKLTKLTSLDLSRNYIWGVDGGLVKLGGLIALTSLDLHLNSFDEEDMEVLVPQLRELTRLTFLRVGGKFMTHSKVAPLEAEFEGRGAHLVVTGRDGYVISDSEDSD
jgi:Leucine-rich repeat (LRR) protein